MKTRKILALLLVLVMMAGLLSMSAFAATAVTVTKTSRTITSATGTTLGTVTVSGMSTTGVSDASWTDDDEATIIVDLIPATTPASGTLSVSFAPSSGSTVTTSVTVTSGEGSGSFTSGSVTYTVTVQSTEEAYPSANTGNNYVGVVDGEGVSIGTFSGSGTSSSPYAATVTGSASGYPFTMSLRIIPEVASFNSLTSYTYTVLDNSGASLTNFVGTYFLAKYTANNTVLRFSIKANQTTKYYAITLSATTGDSGSGIVSYLPAPGQFVNEGIATGGWGEIHLSGSSSLKAIRSAYSSTGVSLGAFGGTVVFDFGSTGISNTTTNKYGVDFVIYGNAFSSNAEPGCVQVAPDANNDGKPDKWYDIAGSLYYSGESVTMYYRNPTPSDNTSNTSTLAAVPYSSNVTINGNSQTWTNASTITTNTFHNHSWFPLARNYFDGVDRTATTYSGTGVSGDMANVSSLKPASGANPIKVMENQSVNNGTSTTVISYKGRLIPWLGASAGNYTFGYADVHANGSSYGTPSNPYTAVASTTGGDGIDISWAVDSDGAPADLTKIRFVRVYTGVQQITAFGEVSTEVCGVYAVSGGGTGSTTATPSVANINNQTVTLSTTYAGMQTVTIPKNTATTVSITGNNSADVLFLNDKSGTGTVSDSFTLAESETQVVRVIAKDSTTGYPFIGYFVLMGS